MLEKNKQKIIIRGRKGWTDGEEERRVVIICRRRRTRKN